MPWITQVVVLSDPSQSHEVTLYDVHFWCTAEEFSNLNTESVDLFDRVFSGENGKPVVFG